MAKITLTQDMLIERDGWAIGHARKITFGPFFAAIGDAELGPAQTKTELLRAIRLFLQDKPCGIAVKYFDNV